LRHKLPKNLKIPVFGAFRRKKEGSVKVHFRKLRQEGALFAKGAWSDPVNLEAIGVPGLVPVDNIKGYDNANSLLLITTHIYQIIQTDHPPAEIASYNEAPSLVDIVESMFLINGCQEETLLVRATGKHGEKSLSISPGRRVPMSPDGSNLDTMISVELFSKGSPPVTSKSHSEMTEFSAQDDRAISKPFSLRQSKTLVLDMGPTGPPLVVDVMGGTDSPIIVHIRLCRICEIPIQVLNLTSTFTCHFAQMINDSVSSNMEPRRQTADVGLRTEIFEIKWRDTTSGTVSVQDSALVTRSQARRGNAKFLYWGTYEVGGQRVIIVHDDYSFMDKLREFTRQDLSSWTLHMDLAEIGISLLSDPMVTSHAPPLTRREFGYLLFASTPVGMGNGSERNYVMQSGLAHERRLRFTRMQSNAVKSKRKAWYNRCCKLRKRNHEQEDTSEFVRSRRVAQVTCEHDVKPTGTQTPGLCVFFAKSDRKVVAFINCGRIQLDSQLSDAMYPVVIHKTSQRFENEQAPMLQIEFVYETSQLPMEESEPNSASNREEYELEEEVKKVHEQLSSALSHIYLLSIKLSPISLNCELGYIQMLTWFIFASMDSWFGTQAKVNLMLQPSLSPKMQMNNSSTQSLTENDVFFNETYSISNIVSVDKQLNLILTRARARYHIKKMEVTLGDLTLSISPLISVHLPLVNPWDVSQEMTQTYENPDELKERATSAQTEFIFRHFLQLFSASFHANDVKINLSPFLLIDVMRSIPELIAATQTHFVDINLKPKLYAAILLGSSMLGGPYQLFNDLGDSVKGLVKLDHQNGEDEVVTQQQEVEERVSDFSRNVSGAFIGTASRMSDALGGTIARVQMDPQLNQIRRILLQKAKSGGPKGSAKAAYQSIVIIMLRGFFGVAHQPQIGFQASGVKGFFAGIGRGLASLVLSPLNATLDTMSLLLTAARL
ncbi:hypothetical protein Ciccas_003633, partial [Cichlidogyrus casuarinus]